MRVKGLSRRTFLRGVGASGALIRIGLPSLEAMTPVKKVEPRFVFWFNGNGIPEKYWIPREVGPDYDLTACLKPLAPFRSDIHVVTGSNFDDTLLGNDGDDFFTPRFGNDSIDGRGGTNDLVSFTFLGTSSGVTITGAEALEPHQLIGRYLDGGSQRSVSMLNTEGFTLTDGNDLATVNDTGTLGSNTFLELRDGNDVAHVFGLRKCGLGDGRTGDYRCGQACKGRSEHCELDDRWHGSSRFRWVRTSVPGQDG